MNNKYYIEVYRLWDGEYICQSKWFDTSEEAVQFADNIDFIDEDYGIDLMFAEYNQDTQNYEDIKKLSSITLKANKLKM